MNFFDKLNEVIREVEGSVVNFISSVAPWGAPLPAAVMSFMHMQGVLGFPVWVAWVVAVTIEILGFSTISTWLSFWSWNRRYTSEKSLKRAPMVFVGVAFGFYLTVVISMNVLLDAASYFPQYLNQNVFVILVRASLTLLTIPAGLIIATRVQHNDLLDEMRKSKVTRVVSESLPKVSPEQVKISSWRTFRKGLDEKELLWIAGAELHELMQKYGLIEETARNWRRYAEVELHGVKEK